MVELFLYLSMTCQDAETLMLRISKNSTELPPSVVLELVETVRESTPQCHWDAND
jgi:hypothetical protein